MQPVHQKQNQKGYCVADVCIILPNTSTLCLFSSICIIAGAAPRRYPKLAPQQAEALEGTRCDGSWGKAQEKCNVNERPVSEGEYERQPSFLELGVDSLIAVQTGLLNSGSVFADFGARRGLQDV